MNPALSQNKVTLKKKIYKSEENKSMNKTKHLSFKKFNYPLPIPNSRRHGCDFWASVSACKGRLVLERNCLNYDSIHQTLTLHLNAGWSFFTF